MINGKRIAVVLPAYNAEKTLEATVREVPDLVDICILVDDHSSDRTIEVAKQLGLQFFQHERNYGYGRNQQTCYREALAAGADVVIMLHPDYHHAAPGYGDGEYGCVRGLRRGAGACRASWRTSAPPAACPIWKYTANPLSDCLRKLLLAGQTLGKSTVDIEPLAAKLVTRLPLLENSDDFVF